MRRSQGTLGSVVCAYSEPSTRLSHSQHSTSHPELEDKGFYYINFMENNLLAENQTEKSEPFPTRSHAPQGTIILSGGLTRSIDNNMAMHKKLSERARRIHQSVTDELVWQIILEHYLGNWETVSPEFIDDISRPFMEKRRVRHVDALLEVN